MKKKKVLLKNIIYKYMWMLWSVIPVNSLNSTATTNNKRTWTVLELIINEKWKLMPSII